MKKLILGIAVALAGCSSGTSGTTGGTSSGSSSGGSSSGGPCATYLGAGQQQAANYAACYVDAGPVDAGPAPTLASCDGILYDGGMCSAADQAALQVQATAFAGCVTAAGTCSASDAGAYLTVYGTCSGAIFAALINGDAGVSTACFTAISGPGGL